MKKIAFVGLLSAIVSTGFAQDSLKSRYIEEVVVTGQYEPQSAMKSVYQVNTIPMERIQRKGATTLQDVLNTELNIRFSQDLATGTSNIYMNGLDGQYVKVLLDGVPLVGKQGVDNAINLGQIDINTIERIEIVDGPMSVLYGADAMAGVINIITKKAFDDKLSASVRIHEESIGKEYATSQGIHNQHAAVSLSHNQLYAKGEFGRNYFGGWKNGVEGRELVWHKKAQLLGSGVVGWRVGDQHLYYRLDYLNENIEDPAEFQLGVARDRDYLTHRFIHQLQGDFTLSDRWSYNGTVAYTAYQRRVRSINVEESTGRETLSLGVGDQDVNKINGFNMRGSFVYRSSDKLSFQPGYEINVDQGSGGRIQAGEKEIVDYALFLSTEYTPVKNISIRPGLRFIQNTKYEVPSLFASQGWRIPIIPSISSKIEITDRSQVRVSYARGFRAPSIRELYFHFVDASHDIHGNTALEPEFSNSFNGSYSYRTVYKNDWKVKWTLSGFYNDVDNMIGYDYGAIRNGRPVTSYININKFISKGITVDQRVVVDALEVGIGLGYTGRSYAYNATDIGNLKSFWSPEINAHVSYEIKPIALTTTLYYKYTGRLQRISDSVLYTQQGFHIGDLSLMKGLGQYMSLTLGARNLFNVTSLKTRSTGGGVHTSDATMGLYGRSYFLSLNFQMFR
jgi:outer membrane receptor for ferrienterochelin and colicins